MGMGGYLLYNGTISIQNLRLVPRTFRNARILASLASIGPADRNSLAGQNPSALSTETAFPAAWHHGHPSALPTETAFPVRIPRPCRLKQHSQSESLGPADRKSMPGPTTAWKQPGTSSTLRSEASSGHVVYATVRIT